MAAPEGSEAEDSAARGSTRAGAKALLPVVKVGTVRQSLGVWVKNWPTTGCLLRFTSKISPANPKGQY